MFQTNSGGFKVYEIFGRDGSYFYAAQAPYPDLQGRRQWACKLFMAPGSAGHICEADTPAQGLVRCTRQRAVLNWR